VLHESVGLFDEPRAGVGEPRPSSDRLDEIRASGKRAAKRARAAEAERDALQAEIGPLRRQAALWKAGIKPGSAADLFLAHLPDTVDLSDPEAVRLACAEVAAALLDGNRQLVEATL
jgi:hypothetical protein